ncbi:hypothetical protein [Desulfolucanica intricata]|uniref:hypothetical protein n=1 Tax=Desulfolucanica intricata TaxID=1285191 RepID=UPI0008363BE4|nr:hypothetical protein [Desulfolucanica intricata]
MVPKFEQETVIRFAEDTDEMIVYTASKRVANWLMKEYKPTKVFKSEGKITGWEFNLNKKEIRIKPKGGRALNIGGQR